MNTKMNAKKALVSFFAIGIVLLLAATVSAGDMAQGGETNVLVKVDGNEVSNNQVSVVAGQTYEIVVKFPSDVNASDVRVKAEIEGDKLDVEDRTEYFDVEDGMFYKKTLSLRVPYELKDELSEFVSLNIKIWNGDHKTEVNDIQLRVQRPSYNTDVMSISTSQTIEAGENFPIDVVLKNIGYNDLDDLYVTAKISELGLQRTAYFGDLVAIECDKDLKPVDNYGVDIVRKCNEDDEDTVIGRIYLKIPYDVESGIYTLDVEVRNDELTYTEAKQVVVENDIASNVIVSGNSIILVNPTDKVKVFRIVPEASEDVLVSISESVVVVGAGSSETVDVAATSLSSGTNTYKVNVFSGDKLISSVTLSTSARAASATNPIVILTIILAIVFLVLIVVLIVLIGKKPSQTEEFGESYY